MAANEKLSSYIGVTGVSKIVGLQPHMPTFTRLLLHWQKVVMLYTMCGERFVEALYKTDSSLV